jgi:Mrp family chromosome partitioning ATPase
MGKAIQATPIKGLNVLAAGSPHPDPGALLESDRTGVLLSKLETVCDVLVLDTAPLLVKTDALHMARYVDRSVVVVESESTTRSAFMNIMGSLASVRLEPLGVVVNKCPVRRGSDRYGLYGYAGYGKDDFSYRNPQGITALTHRKEEVGDL